MTAHYGSLGGCGWLFNRLDNNCYYADQYCCGQGTDKRFFPWDTPPLAWWTTYMQEIYELLQDSPSGETVRTAADRTIQKVRSANCNGCAGRVKEAMTEFSNLLALKVEEAVAPIELEMDF